MKRPPAEGERHDVPCGQSSHGRTGDTAREEIIRRVETPDCRPASRYFHYCHRALGQERPAVSHHSSSYNSPSINNYSPKSSLCMNYGAELKIIARKVLHNERNAYLCRRITQKQHREYANVSTLLVVAWFDDSIVAKHDAFMCHTEKDRKRLVGMRRASFLFNKAPTLPPPRRNY